MYVTYTYEVLINLSRDKSFRRHADELIGDPFVFTYRGTVGIDKPIPGAFGPLDAAWRVLYRHNQDDRPDGLIGPSFSIGDAVTIINDRGDRYTFVDADSQFVQIDGELPNVERVKQWRQYIDEVIR